MSKRSKIASIPPPPSPVPSSVPVPYSNAFQYTIDDGVVTFYFGHGDRWVAVAAMSVNLARDLQLKLGTSLNPPKPAHIPL